MNTLFQDISKWTFAAMLVLFAACAANAQDPRLQISNLDYLAGKASQTVDVNIDERLLLMTAKFFSANDPDEKEIRDLISGLKGIYVRVFAFEHENEYAAGDVESIRAQLRNPGWTKILNINSKKEGSVEVYLMTANDRISGLVVLGLDPKELTIVNIIGPVDLSKLSKLEGQFGVPDLDIEPPAKNKSQN